MIVQTIAQTIGIKNPTSQKTPKYIPVTLIANKDIRLKVINEYFLNLNGMQISEDDALLSSLLIETDMQYYKSEDCINAVNQAINDLLSKDNATTFADEIQKNLQNTSMLTEEQFEYNFNELEEENFDYVVQNQKINQTNNTIDPFEIIKEENMYYIDEQKKINSSAIIEISSDSEISDKSSEDLYKKIIQGISQEQSNKFYENCEFTKSIKHQLTQLEYKNRESSIKIPKELIQTVINAIRNCHPESEKLTEMLMNRKINGATKIKLLTSNKSFEQREDDENKSCEQREEDEILINDKLIYIANSLIYRVIKDYEETYLDEKSIADISNIKISKIILEYIYENLTDLATSYIKDGIIIELGSLFSDSKEHTSIICITQNIIDKYSDGSDDITITENLKRALKDILKKIYSLETSENKYGITFEIDTDTQNKETEIKSKHIQKLPKTAIDKKRRSYRGPRGLKFKNLSKEYKNNSISKNYTANHEEITMNINQSKENSKQQWLSILKQKVISIHGLIDLEFATEEVLLALLDSQSISETSDEFERLSNYIHNSFEYNESIPEYYQHISEKHEIINEENINAMLEQKKPNIKELMSKESNINEFTEQSIVFDNWNNKINKPINETILEKYDTNIPLTSHICTELHGIEQVRLPREVFEQCIKKISKISGESIEELRKYSIPMLLRTCKEYNIDPYQI